MKKMLERMKNSRFLVNTGWMMFAQIYQMLISLIIGVITARYLGPSNYGILNYSASYISFFTIACQLGLEGIVVKEIINDRENEGVILGSSIAMRLIAGALSVVLVCVIIWIINPNDSLLLAVSFLQSLILIFNAFNIIDCWYQSNLQSKTTTIFKCIAYTAMSIYKVVLLIFGKSVVWFAFSTSLDSLVISILLLWHYRHNGKKQLKNNAGIGKRLFFQSYHLIISSLMAVIYSQMDKIMIGKIMDQTNVGFYSAATTICHMWMFIPQALSSSARPLIVDLKNRDEKIYLKRLKQLNFVTFWIGVGFATAITVFSKFIINVLYGSEYFAAREPLMLIVWSVAISALSYPNSIWMVCEGNQRYNKYILIWGVFINLTLNAVGIPLLGMKGAAIATIATEFVCCFIAPLFYRRTRIYIKYLIESIVGIGIK